MNRFGKQLNRKVTKSFLWLMVAALSVGLLVACGGGGGSSSGGGGASPGLSAGQITALGSIFVNGVEFETTGAEIEIEGMENPTDDSLQPGMVVEVEGSFDDNSGTASRVFAEDALEGPIGSVATSSTGLVKTLSVMGQTVIVEQGVTMFDNSVGAVDFNGLAAGMVIEVSGQPNAAGDIVATRVERKAADMATFLAAGNLLEVKGTAINVGATSFTLGGLTIDFTDAVLDETNGPLTDNVLVEVKGDGLTGTTLHATIVEVEDDGLGLDDLAKVHLEGFVANLSGSTFTLSGQDVAFTGATIFRGGVEGDLANGMKVEAEGPISNGVLQATKITFKESVRLEGNVVVETNGFAIEGLPGILVTVDPVITDERTQASLVNSGEEVRLRARPSGSGASATLMATRFERVDTQSADRLIIQAPVTSISGSNIVLLDQVTVDTSMIADTSFDDSTGTESSNFEIEDREVSRTEFFAQLQVGDIVKARARLNDATSTWDWDEVEIEIED